MSGSAVLYHDQQTKWLLENVAKAACPRDRLPWTLYTSVWPEETIKANPDYDELHCSLQLNQHFPGVHTNRSDQLSRQGCHRPHTFCGLKPNQQSRKKKKKMLADILSSPEKCRYSSGTGHGHWVERIAWGSRCDSLKCASYIPVRTRVLDWLQHMNRGIQQDTRRRFQKKIWGNIYRILTTNSTFHVEFAGSTVPQCRQIADSA